MIAYRECPPRAELAPYLECLWSATGRIPGGHEEAQRIVPDGCPELIVQLGDPFERLTGSRWRRQPKLFVAGTLTAPWLLRAGRVVTTLGARFRPGAIRALLPLDMVAGRDRETALAAIVGARPATDLHSALCAARSIENRFEQLELWLVDRLVDSRRAPALETAGRVLASRGRCRVDELAGPGARERRALQRLFRRELGISPKRFARIVRLNALLARLDGAKRETAVDLALELGFFDQAHMLRDLRLLAGRRLTAREADGKLARNFTRPERLRRLLTAALEEPAVSHSSKRAESAAPYAGRARSRVATSERRSGR